MRKYNSGLERLSFKGGKHVLINQWATIDEPMHNECCIRHKNPIGLLISSNQKLMPVALLGDLRNQLPHFCAVRHCCAGLRVGRPAFLRGGRGPPRSWFSFLLFASNASANFFQIFLSYEFINRESSSLSIWPP